MKRLLSVLLLFFVFMGYGCQESLTASLAGVPALAATERILDDLEGITDREKALVLAERLALEDKLQAATSESERANLEVEIAKRVKTEEALSIANESIDTLGIARRTDWKDPAGVAPWLLAALTTGLGVWTRKGKTTLEAELKRYNAEVNKYMAEAEPAEAKKLVTRLNGGS